MPRKIVSELNCNKINNAAHNKIARKISACKIEILPEAKGRALVRLTFLSKLRSKISLMMQPTLRISAAPKKNNKIICGEISEEFSLASNAKANKQGRNRSQMPIGLSRRIN